MSTKPTTDLYRPVNQAELDLIQESGWTKFPPRLPEQPIFYPVMNEEYAIQICKEWNVPAYGVGYVTKFAVFRLYEVSDFVALCSSRFTTEQLHHCDWHE